MNLRIRIFYFISNIKMFIMAIYLFLIVALNENITSFFKMLNRRFR